MSLVAELHNAHKARVAAIAAKAAEHEARKKSALIAEIKQCCELKPEPKPTPEPIEDGWVDRQIEKQKALWFTVISATKLTPAGQPTIRSIQRATCDVYGVKLNDLLSARRRGIHHPSSSSLDAIRKIERILKSDEKLAGQIAAIRGRLA